MILVTGASGFIGKALVQKLAEKYGKQNIVLLTSKPNEQYAYLLHNGYSFSPDFFIKSGYENIHTLIHAGAFTPKSGSEANNVADSNSNISNTETLLNASLPNLKKVIFLSTIDVYPTSSEVLSESTAINPETLYGLSKYYGERMIEAWAKDNQVDYQVLRIGHVYGPGEESYNKVIPIVIKRLLNNQSLALYGEGNEFRTFIYITDVIHAILSAIELKENIGPVNIVGDKGIMIKNLLDLLLKISNKEVKLEKIAINHIPKSMLFDNTKARLLLPEDLIPIDVGLQKEWDYMKQLLA